MNTDRMTDRRMYIQIDRQTERNTDGNTDRRPYLQTDRQMERNTDGKTDRKTDRRAYIQTDRQTERNTDGKTDRRTYILTYIQTDRQTSLVLVCKKYDLISFQGLCSCKTEPTYLCPADYIFNNRRSKGLFIIWLNMFIAMSSTRFEVRNIFC